MKYIIYAICFSLIYIGCSTGKYPTETEDAMKYRQVAWNSLSDQEKETITTDWQEAKVSPCRYWENNQQVVCVTFNTTLDPLLGPIIVYIEPRSMVILGYAPRY